jgi:hypothetical protein
VDGFDGITCSICSLSVLHLPIILYGHISGSASLILWMLVLLKAWSADSSPGTSIDQLRTEWKMKKEKKYQRKKPAIEDMTVKTKIEG